MAKVGFIGLGNMGSGMAANLVKSGHEVQVFDLNETAVQAAVSIGAVAQSSVADCVGSVDAVVTMLPAAQHVRSVYEGEGGVLAFASEGTLLIDCSTIDVESARAVSALASTRGFDMCDAPVSGGVAAAQGGSLTFMVGGSSEGFAKAEPILNSMGKAVIHAGDAGAGQAAKICNNMLLAISMIGTCEAFVLAEKLGLSAQTFFDISSKASGQCWSMTSYCPAAGPVPTAPSNNDYQPGFGAPLMLKDLKLAMSAAESVKASTPMGAKAEALYETYVNKDGIDKDFSGIIKLIASGLV